VFSDSLVGQSEESPGRQDHTKELMAAVLAWSLVQQPAASLVKQSDHARAVMSQVPYPLSPLLSFVTHAQQYCYTSACLLMKNLFLTFSAFMTLFDIHKLFKSDPIV
jgi:hypothetical protein